MKLVCPKCHSPIGAENVNVVTDLAKCTMCNEIFKASELMADIDLAEGLDPPVGSRIVVDTETGEYSFFIPRRGFKWIDLYTILFVTCWTGGIAFWSWGAAQTSVVFAAFSIPFWVIAVTMWVGLGISITQTQNIALEYEALVLTKKSVIHTKVHIIPYSEIESLDTESVYPRNPFRMIRHRDQFAHTLRVTGVLLPTIWHGTKKVRFAEHVSEAEMKWLVQVLKTLVYDRIGRKV